MTAADVDSHPAPAAPSRCNITQSAWPLGEGRSSPYTGGCRLPTVHKHRAIPGQRRQREKLTSREIYGPLRPPDGPLRHGAGTIQSTLVSCGSAGVLGETSPARQSRGTVPRVVTGAVVSGHEARSPPASALVQSTVRPPPSAAQSQGPAPVPDCAPTTRRDDPGLRSRSSGD